jgi:hypothetical protein
MWKVSDTISMEGRNSRGRYVSAGVTNGKGAFSLPPPDWSVRSPLRTYARDPDVIAMKPGYKYLTTFGNRVVMWPLPSTESQIADPTNPDEIARVLREWIAFQSLNRELRDFAQVRAAVATYARMNVAH